MSVVLCSENKSFSRSRKYTKDPEKLMYEKQELKETTNKLKDENIKLKTRVLFLDKEINKRDKFVEQTISNQPFRPKQSNLIIKTSLANNLKKQLREAHDQIRSLQTEVQRHQKARKTTTINELESTVEVLTEECKRLRDLLKSALKREDQVGSKGL